jgi:hypothetical protein
LLPEGTAMNLNYVPLLPLQRQIQGLPRDYARFQEYLRQIMNAERTGPALTPLLLANPMAKEHVTALLDALLALDADGIAARASAEVSGRLEHVPGEYDVGLVVVDDLKGGWTNRYAAEFTIRFQSGPPPERPPRWMTTRPWVYGVLWSSEPADEKTVREAILTAIHRMAYVQHHGLAQTLRARLAQEGHVMAAAGCTTPTLDADDIAYTREVLEPFLDADDMRTTIECLFGDAAGRTLGFSPRGLSPCAGLALALHEARADLHLTQQRAGAPGTYEA